jgi:hypothetical protein
LVLEVVEVLDQVQVLHPVVEMMEAMETLQLLLDQAQLHLQPVEEVLDLEVRQVLLLMLEVQVDQVVE